MLKRRSRSRRVPLKYFIPNVITAVSLCAGLASLHFSTIADFDRALQLIGLAAIIDAMDGRAARLLHVTSRFGAVLDSLADFLSFGVAPAVLLYQWLPHEESFLAPAAMMAFVLCSALRLARFTSQVADRPTPLNTKFFTGLPTPAAAAAVLIPVMVSVSKPKHGLADWQHGGGVLGGYAGPIVNGLTFLVAWLMISRVPMFSFKKLRVGRSFVPLIMFAVALVFAFAIFDYWLALAAVAFAYVATAPLSILSHRRLRDSIAALAGPSGHAATVRVLATEPPRR